MKKNTRIRHRKYNTRKKYIFPLVCLSILLGLSLVGVFANVGDIINQSDGFSYKVTKEHDASTSSGEVMLVGYSGDATTIEIPETVSVTGSETKLYTVTAVGYENNSNITTPLKGNSALQQITFAENSAVKSIDKEAFAGCSGLRTIDLTNAEGLETIGNSAFRNCYDLTTVSFPGSITKIDGNAFANCVSLNTLKGLVNNSAVRIASGAFYGCCYLDAEDDNKKAINLPAITEDGNNPDPFNAEKMLNNFTTETRGIEKINRIQPTAGGNDFDDKFPLRYFMDQEYRIMFDLDSGYEVVGLDLFKNVASIPNGNYTINDTYFKPTGNTEAYDFTVDSNEWTEQDAVLFAVATANKTSGAPTITTDGDLPDGAEGVYYEEPLIAESSSTSDITWTIVPGSGNLPSGLQIVTDPETGDTVISGTPKLQGNYTFTLQATNDISYHQKRFSINIHDKTLAAVDNLKWKEIQTGTLCAVWDPLKYPVSSTIKYSVQLYKDGEKYGDPVIRELLNDSEGNTSSFAQVNFANEIKQGGRGVYTFTVTASNNEYGSKTSEMSKEHLEDIETYNVRAIAGANGTVTLDAGSREKLSFDDIKEAEDGSSIELIIREGAVSEATPLTFHIIPNNGYEAETVTMNDAATPSKSSYSFTKFEKDVNEYTLAAQFDLISNRIDGIEDKSKHTQGTVLSFEAIGEDMDSAGETGATRWLPVSWELSSDTMAHAWKKDPYSDDIDTAELETGDYTLYVTFQKQAYNKDTGRWSDVVDAVEIKSVDFTVEALFPMGGNDSDEDKDSDKDSNKDSDKADKNKDKNKDKDKNSDATTGSEVSANGSGSGNGSSGSGSAIDSLLSAVKTGDDMQIALWGALALLSLMGIGFCLFRLIRFNR